MVDSSGARETPSSCPFIGLADDAASRFTFADPDHRCRAGSQPADVALPHQSSFCLTDQHPACERYLARADSGTDDPAGTTLPGTTVPGAGGDEPPTTLPGAGGDDHALEAPASPEPSVPAAIAALAAPTLPHGTPRAGRSAGTWLAGVLALLLVAGIAGYGLAFLSSELVGRGSEVAAAAATNATGAPPAATGPGGTTLAGAGPASTPSPPTPRPSPTLTASAVPTRTGGTTTRTHIVQPGETLFSIATRYGLTVAQLAAANNISDVNTIYAGQKLVIPGP